MYNIPSTHRLVVDYDEPICNRAKLDTGTHCNYRCGFCYYKDQLTVRTDWSVIKERIDYLVECGITEVDLSGGESSIHFDWFKILDYCKSKGLKISTLSNGYKFSKLEFTQKSKDHGLEEILFSVHGYDDDSHNSLVGFRKGFEKIKQAIHNAHEVGMRVRVNCTVTHDNCVELDTTFVELMEELHPMEVNFLTLNYWDDAGTQKTIDYEYITPFIKGAIDKLNVPIINVRYTPYCFMKGYEKHVCNYFQHIYDVLDWNIAVYDMKIDPEAYKADRYQALHDAATKNRMSTYRKEKECLDCKHYYICDGVEKKIEYVELKAEPGEKITNVNHYRKGWYANIQRDGDV